ncbi:MAG TPA: 1-acyl-sn-glycerol-3-phosphate acyltransferase [Leptolyngbyaceae cyanobacterium]
MDFVQQIASFNTFAKDTQVFLDLFLKACMAPSHTLRGCSLDERDPAVIEKLLPFFGWFYRDYFRVKTDGWEHVPSEGKVLLVGSHNGGLAAPDTVMMAYDWFQRFGTERPVYGLMDPRIWRIFPGLGRIATQVGTLQATSHMAIKALRRDAGVLIYPGGLQDVFRPHALQKKIYFQGNTGFVKLALMESAPIVPLISYGAHSTLFVLADLYPQLEQLHKLGMPWPFGLDPGTYPIYLGLPWGLSPGPLPNIPLPIQIHTRVCPPVTFDRYGHEAVRDADYVNECYNKVYRHMQHHLDQLFAEEEGPEPMPISDWITTS